MTAELVATAASAVTATLGAVVAWLAFRGYRRNDSPVMRGLAVGVAAIAVVPFFLTIVGELLALSDAQALLGITLAHTVGLLAIYRTFRSD
ncbi:DUF7521 family protein [Haloarcula sediminis]|uniref:DUF7521 family protein n=1 Tax=Haloarcula sediminis TaxID=3111777 RepID=UPI002D787328|nr:hypothetical protein [Haloarcula sp. CK38]